jgi:hypothetical protein
VKESFQDKKGSDFIYVCSHPQPIKLLGLDLTALFLKNSKLSAEKSLPLFNAASNFLPDKLLLIHNSIYRCYDLKKKNPDKFKGFL